MTDIRLGDYTIAVQVVPPGTLPPGSILVLPGPKRHDETRERYARRCKLIKEAP